MTLPRVALVAFYGECNTLVPQRPPDEFRWMGHFRGPEVLAALEDSRAFLPTEFRSFYAEMNRTGSWQPVPIVSAIAASGPPFHEEMFRVLMRDIDLRLSAAGRIDAVYVAAHGSVRTEQTLDCEGALYSLVRDRVGPSVPIVSTLDLHGKISPQMAAMADLLISYRTNPHIDMADRGIEAARAVRRMLVGERIAAAHIRVPILAPQTALDSRTGAFARATELAIAGIVGNVAAVGVLGGFSPLDTPFNGVNVYVASWGDSAEAAELAVKVAEECWQARAATRPSYVPLERAIAAAIAAGADRTGPACCIADIADNPGGGALGNTTFILRALLEAQARGVVVGPFWEPDAAAQAYAAGIGGTVEMELNGRRVSELARPLRIRGQVVSLHPGLIAMGKGVADGVLLDHGPMAAIDLGGVTLVVTTIAYQALSLAQFEALGISPSTVRCFVLKSRGHFRAAFEGLIDPANIMEVAVPGYTTPMIETLLLRNVQRPIWPFDADMRWTARRWLQIHDTRLDTSRKMETT